MADYKKLIPFILKWEGGFVNDPLDKGGATNKGITISTFRQVFGKNKTVNDLKHITDEQWDYIFKSYYWDRYKADSINNQSIANICVDWVWASGIWGIKKVQQLLNTTADGIVGPKTINAINNQHSEELFNKIKKARIIFVENIVKHNPSQKRFLKGWLNRINNIQYEP